MALLWLDGFDMYGTSTGVAVAPTSIMDRRYYVSTGENLCDVETGRFDGYLLEGPTSGTTNFAPVNGLTTNVTLIAGVALKQVGTIDLQNGEYNRIFSFCEGTTVSLVLRMSGQTLEVYSGSTLLVTPVRLNLKPNTWYYVEMKAKCDNSTGTVEVRVNGTPVINVTGVDNRQGALGYYNIVRLGEEIEYYAFDDFYICDGSGSVNNDFLGPIHIHTIRPNAAGSTNNFTSGTYADLDETQVDDDTTYAETVTSGHRLTCNYAATSNFATIKGICVNNVISANAALNVAVVTISGATTNVSANISANTTNNSTYNTKIYISELDPNTSTAWTPSTINSAEFGIELK